MGDEALSWRLSVIHAHRYLSELSLSDLRKLVRAVEQTIAALDQGSHDEEPEWQRCWSCYLVSSCIFEQSFWEKVPGAFLLECKGVSATSSAISASV